MARPRFRTSARSRRLVIFALLPAIVIAVGIIAFFTIRTTLQLERLRKQSVVEATLALATEKADRLDKRIVEEDNAVLAIVDLADIGRLTERWIPTSLRETPSVQGILVLSQNGTVVATASRSLGPSTFEESFRHLLTQKIRFDMDDKAPPDQLRHLHRDYGGHPYLVSYAYRVYQSERYLIVAWHDVGRIVREILPSLYSEAGASGSNRVNIVDDNGRIVYGPPLRADEFTVAVRLPTTLYNWRVQVSPTASKELATRVQNRRLLELFMVTLSSIVVVAGVVMIFVAAEKDRRISDLKSEFVANVSHELKTPLALVRMFAEMLQSGRVASDAKRQEYLDIIVTESERLSGLIENVLDFAKVERGRGAYDFTVGSIAEAVTRGVNVLRYRAERDGVELDLHVEPGIPLTRVDEKAIELATINLIDNALKYAPESKQIRVSVSRGDGVIFLRVSDDGPGIAPEERRNIFERFVRGRGEGAAEARKVRGSGIGLALVRHIAESHGGGAWVESNVGKGSTFVLTIPSPERWIAGA